MNIGPTKNRKTQMLFCDWKAVPFSFLFSPVDVIHISLSVKKKNLSQNDLSLSKIKCSVIFIYTMYNSENHPKQNLQ